VMTIESKREHRG